LAVKAPNIPETCSYHNRSKHTWSTMSLSMLTEKRISPVARLAGFDPQQKGPRQGRQSLLGRQHLLPVHLPHDTPERPDTISHCITHHYSLHYSLHQHVWCVCRAAQHLHCYRIAMVRTGSSHQKRLELGKNTASALLQLCSKQHKAVTSTALQ